jgi:hypothetical protein
MDAGALGQQGSKDVEDLQIALLECAMEYEIKVSPFSSLEMNNLEFASSMQKIPVLACLAISRPVLLLCSMTALVNPSSCPKMSYLTHEINMVQTIEMKMRLKTIGSQQPSKSTQLRLESGLSSIVCSSKSSDIVLVVTTGTFLGALSHALSL